MKINYPNSIEWKEQFVLLCFGWFIKHIKYECHTMDSVIDIFLIQIEEKSKKNLWNLIKVDLMK